jgi:hypothetical protein
MCKGTITSQFVALPWHFPGRTEEYHEELARVAGVTAEIQSGQVALG